MKSGLKKTAEKQLLRTRKKNPKKTPPRECTFTRTKYQ